MGDKVGENPAARSAAVFLLFAKNRRGQTPPSRAKDNNLLTGCAIKIYPSKKTVLLKNGTTYRLQNFRVYVEMYSNQNYMHKLGYFRPQPR